MKKIVLKEGGFFAFQWPSGTVTSREARMNLPEFIKTLLDAKQAWYSSYSEGIGLTIAQGGLLSVKPLDWIIYHPEALIVLSPSQFSLLFTLAEQPNALPISTPEQ